MYWFCPRVQYYINSIKKDMLEHYHIDLHISAQNWFFPSQLRAMETCIISLAKMVIFEARLKEAQLNIVHLKNKINWEAEIERNIATLSNKRKLFEKKWGPLKDMHIHQTDSTDTADPHPTAQPSYSRGCGGAVGHAGVSGGSPCVRLSSGASASRLAGLS